MYVDTRFIDPVSSGGGVATVGFYNEGNQCYRNAMLQCLMQCTDLVKQFLSLYLLMSMVQWCLIHILGEEYLAHADETNSSNHRHLAMAFSDLVRQVYSGRYKEIAPYTFRVSYISLNISMLMSC